MQHIVIDCRFAGTPTGLGRYTRELASRLVLDSRARWTLLCDSANPLWLPTDAHAAAEIVHIPYSHYSLAEQIRLPQLLRSLNADLFFAPHFNVPLRCPTPFVVTVHDLILHHYPNNASLLRQAAYRLLIHHAVTQSVAVIAISAFVQSEIVSLYPRHSTVHCIPQGIPHSFTPPPPSAVQNVREQYQLTKPFVLYVGNCKQHKNVSLLLDAFRLSPPPPYELVIVGFGNECAALKSANTHVHWLSDVSDEDLRGLYGAAALFVSPSLYEGSCLPAAEALACGCVVAGANRGALPELLEGRGILFEPTLEAMNELLHATLPAPKAYTMRSFDTVANETADVLIRSLDQS